MLNAASTTAVRYFVEFAAQAWRVFPNYRDRQRARGHKARACDNQAHALVVDLPWLRRLYRDRCLYCAGRSQHIDHLWPLADRGDDAPWNVVPACSPCNLSKSATPLRVWLPGRLSARTAGEAEATAALWAELAAT
ncbi:5-methylcytosine-specific restriction endonuclease McrA [Actinokineospora baliensis]|uniref:HNH endonuclease n=1 Tax=Actinokineospora baliensis TaxID=547056 RepID=UPI0019575321|nr:HNH endonuclease signature motif containing protein [Actinokineospora baliensis]MBM7770883.1 5-methylcytosine-specific restriction endonuclease McrA [Actinokineospora baliensis]